MKIGYYINDKFILDDGRLAGINIMLFNGDKLNYWFDEFRCDSVEEAEEFIKTYDGDMVEVKIAHPISNRQYPKEEVESL